MQMFLFLADQKFAARWRTRFWRFLVVKLAIEKEESAKWETGFCMGNCKSFIVGILIQYSTFLRHENRFKVGLRFFILVSNVFQPLMCILTRFNDPMYVSLNTWKVRYTPVFFITTQAPGYTFLWLEPKVLEQVKAFPPRHDENIRNTIWHFTRSRWHVNLNYQM